MSLSRDTTLAVRDVLAGRRRGLRALLPLAGPAVIASIAYVDPGNIATNVAAGAATGYRLLWVVLAANLTAMLFQALSAKLGLVTGQNLAELCRAHTPPAVSAVLWLVSELAAMATDLAEFLGGAIGLALLCHLPLLAGMGLTAAATYALLLAGGRGFRLIELAIGGLIAIIAACYLTELVIARIDWRLAAYHAVVPSLAGPGSFTLAVGIVGATVMPHAIFLHSGLMPARVPPRDAAERRQMLRFSNREVVAALSAAGLVNIAILLMAAAAFHRGHPGIADLATAYRTLTPLLGAAAGGVFLTALMASGLASSTVGTLAGQIIMQGFLGWRVPLWLRRLVTMLPAFAVVAAGVNPTRALVLSQVVLSFVLPVPLVALVLFTGNRRLMGVHRNAWPVQAAAIAGAALVVSLNLALVVHALAA